MGLFDIFKRRPTPAVKARYELSRDSNEMRRHWQSADLLSGNEWANAADRQKMRARSRHEVFNNGYAKGMVEKLSRYVIGRGPRLQMKSDDRDTNQAIERAFSEWAKEIKLARKLRLMRKARCIDGESFAVFVENPKLKSPIKIDLRIYEADQVTSPFSMANQPDEVDGIKFDAFDNPVTYSILKQHPGDLGSIGNSEAVQVEAEKVIHYFLAERAGQKRGVPEIAASIRIFAELRRYELAVLAAAETAASFAMVGESTAPADEESGGVSDTIELERNMLTFLPTGYKLGQTKPEQPTTTFKEFKHEVLNEAGAPVHMPLNILLCNSSGYNYSSGRLDHQTFAKSIDIDRDEIAADILDRIFDVWFDLAVLSEDDVIPQAARLRDFDSRRDWYWDGFEHVDPQKEDAARQTRLQSHMTTFAAEFAKDGKDWQDEMDQMARERAYAKQIGLELAAAPAAQSVAVSNEDEDETEEE